jgi:hypothetical protein
MEKMQMSKIIKFGLFATLILFSTSSAITYNFTVDFTKAKINFQHSSPSTKYFIVATAFNLCLFTTVAIANTIKHKYMQKTDDKLTITATKTLKVDGTVVALSAISTIFVPLSMISLFIAMVRTSDPFQLLYAPLIAIIP